MRELKFRVWLEGSRFWIMDLNNLPANPKSLDTISENPKQQYIGINDKNGAEIFEGDILSGVNLFNYPGRFRGDVEYHHGRWQYTVIYPGKGLGGGCIDEEEVEEHQLEVIGNIFENPELANAAQLK